MQKNYLFFVIKYIFLPEKQTISIALALLLPALPVVSAEHGPDPATGTK